MDTTRTSIPLPQSFDAALFCGPHDEILRAIEARFDCCISLSEGSISLTSKAGDVAIISSVIQDAIALVCEGGNPTVEQVSESIEVLSRSSFEPSALRNDVLLTYRGHAIRPKTSGQKAYCDAIRTNTITFGIGPAGTGKTYLAMAMAISALKRKEIARIILTRPVVEAGENLGFLPGTLTEKVDPYIRPLYDALFDLTDAVKGNGLIEQGVIEIAPLAFMRGRTFNDSFLILDEAQNTTPDQMKMFLTRLGFGSKMVVTGDITQIDMPQRKSGLKEVRRVLADVEDIAFCEMNENDVVRHNLVARIVKAYESAYKNQREEDSHANRD